METIVLNVSDIDADDRPALEHVVGQSLREDQQLIIRIVNAEVQTPVAKGGMTEESGLPSWCNVYAGLSDEEIAEVEKIALMRADLTRPSK